MSAKNNKIKIYKCAVKPIHTKAIVTRADTSRTKQVLKTEMRKPETAPKNWTQSWISFMLLLMLKKHNPIKSRRSNTFFPHYFTFI